VRDLISASKYRKTTTVLCCENESLFSNLDIRTYSPSVDAHKRRKALFAAAQAKEGRADLIVVQNHLPTAAALARRVSVPVILHKHNLTKPVARSGIKNAARRAWRLREYRSLAGIIFVSKFCQDAFIRDWPEVQTPKTIVYNGLDFEDWTTHRQDREKEIICVARAAPEKGVKEAAQAIAQILINEKDWRARLILGETQRFPEYTRAITEIIQTISSRVVVEHNLPLSAVKERCQRAAIAVVPSKWEEPFGRTALEAHAAGCAVVSSGTGGLSEISGKHALFLPKRTEPEDITSLLKKLIYDQGLRARLAAAGRRHCQEKFSLAKIAAIADAFYEQAVLRLVESI
jgi:glycosyltransferase involved in cell wall biosynthesis